jgi:large repetitive protein
MLDIKKGELHRGDFIEGSCSNRVIEQVKARRTQGEVGGPQTEGRPAGPLQFRGKAPAAPRGATDSADQPLPSQRGPGERNADAPR